MKKHPFVERPEDFNCAVCVCGEAHPLHQGHEARDVEGKDVRVGSIVWFPEERPQRQKVVGIPEDGMVLIVPADGSDPGDFADLPMFAWRGRRVKY